MKLKVLEIIFSIVEENVLKTDKKKNKETAVRFPSGLAHYIAGQVLQT